MADLTASSEPKLEKKETELATNPLHGEGAEKKDAPAAVCTLLLFVRLWALAAMLFQTFTPLPPLQSC